jgi:phosphohistidine phosphatase SixA
MDRRSIVVLIGVLGIAACTGVPLRDAALADRLHGGGYVIFFRHAATEKTKDQDAHDLADCAAQRNLSSDGQAQARAIGDTFRATNVPVGDVRSSEYCRCLDTARLAFGRVEPEPALTSYYRLPESARAQAVEGVKALLAHAPEAGTHTVLVGHHDMFRDATHIMLAEGEAAVIEPLGEHGFRVIAQVRAEAWARFW